MNCQYDVIALILFFITALGCMFYISRLKKHYKNTENLYDEYGKYFKK